MTLYQGHHSNNLKSELPVREHATTCVMNKSIQVAAAGQLYCSCGAHYSTNSQLYDQREDGTIESLCEKASEFSDSIGSAAFFFYGTTN